MGPVVEELAGAFARQSAQVEFEVAPLGTQLGLDALREGTVELTFASWLMPVQEGADRAEEPPLPVAGLVTDADWQVTAIARDGVAIIVHPTNQLDGVGLLQLKDLFSGRAYEWQAVGGEGDLGVVQPVSREVGSGSRAAFEVLVMEDLPVTPRAVVVPSPEGVINFVAEHPEAVGYVSSGLVTPYVKVLEIEGEAPTLENLGQGVYPLTRELWLVTGAQTSLAIREFVDFALGPAGQEIVGRRHGRVQ
jgi:phosphate transport system substrate-binding protein